MAKRARLTLGARKVLRLLERDGITINAFAGKHKLNRWTLERLLKGITTRIDIDLVARLVKAFEAGALDPLDFARRAANDSERKAIGS